MPLQFVTPNQHGVGDFAAATGLIVLPFLLGLQSPAMIWVSVGMGLFLIGYSLLTDYRFGILKVLPFPGHLAIDWFDAVVFAASPSALGLHGLDAWYSYAVAAGVVGIVVVTMPHAPKTGAPAGSRR